MKKRFSLLLALILAASLCACGGGDDPKPSGSGGGKEPDAGAQEQSAPDPDPGADEPEEAPGEAGPSIDFDWPAADYIPEAAKWSGGTILYVENKTYGGGDEPEFPVTRIYIDAATLEDVESYVAALKDAGYAFVPFWPGDDEPEFAFDWGVFGWVGAIQGASYIDISVYEEPQDNMFWVGDDIHKFQYCLKLSFTSKTVTSGRIAV